MNFHENGISNLPKIPKPIKNKKSLYREPRDHTRPTLPPHVDRPSSYSDRGSDSDDSDNHHEDHDSDDDNPYESDYDRARRQRIIDKSNERETRVGTYGRNPTRKGRNPNPNYTEIIIEDVNNQSFKINVNDKLGDLTTPETYEQASNSDQKVRWLESMKKEITDLLKHETWELVSIDDIPKGRKITKSK